VKPSINSHGLHPELSHNKLPMEGANLLWYTTYK
jgi:hypothetical protein